jgi:predicted Zn-dependent protease
MPANRCTTPAVASLAAAFFALGCGAPGLEDLRYRGDTRMSTGQYDQAAEAYQQYIDRNPGNPYIRAAAGKAYLKAGQPNQAAYHLRVAISQRPQEEETLNDLCEALLQSGQRDELFRTLRANAADRGNTNDFIRLGRYALALGDIDTARTALLTAAKIDKGRTVGPQVALVDFYTALQDPANAERRLRMAAFVDRQSTEVLRRVRDLGVIDGPTFPMPPEEYVPPAPAPENVP